jgi:hypothetical protein
MIAAQNDNIDDNPGCTLIGGDRSATDRATLQNNTLVCGVDFNGNFLA